MPARLRLTFRRVLCNLLWAIASLYALSLLYYLSLRAIAGDRLWPVALASVFLPWLMFPALILLPLALWRRRWATGALLGVSVAVFVWLYGELFLPRLDLRFGAGPASGARPVDLTFMTYNAYRVPADALVKMLRASHADVIGLQELDRQQTAAIARALTDLYPYRVLYLDERSHTLSALGLLSRHPIAQYRYFYMSTGRPNIHAALDVEGRDEPLAVIVTHPPSPGLGRGGYHIHELADDEITGLIPAATTGAPTVLLGDFNTSDQSDLYRPLRDAALVDAFRAAGWGFGFTWPVRLGGVPLLPLARIDYIWHTAHFRALEAWVGPDAGSDHLPVLARLAWG